MNLHKVKNKYPKAFKTLVQWVDDQHLYTGWNIEGHILKNPKGYIGDNYRNLYDFFDQQGIHINVYSEYYMKGTSFCTQITWYNSKEIAYHGGTYSYEGYKTRIQAESKGFKMAFKILNKQL